MYELFITLYLLLSLSIVAVKIEILYYWNFVLLSPPSRFFLYKVLDTYLSINNYLTDNPGHITECIRPQKTELEKQSCIVSLLERQWGRGVCAGRKQWNRKLSKSCNRNKVNNRISTIFDTIFCLGHQICLLLSISVCLPIIVRIVRMLIIHLKPMLFLFK